MILRLRQQPCAPRSRAFWVAAALALPVACAHATDWPLTPQQRSIAQKVASAGVPLSELAPNAPDEYRIRRGDTLWGISKIFLKSPWRWPELWGMNMEQIKNPHWIYPGQILVLEKIDGRARLRMGKALGGTDQVKLSPKVREEPLENGAISSIPMNLIGPFLNDAMVFETDALNQAPRVVATSEERVLLSRGDIAYVRGDLGAHANWQIFRQPKPLKDPVSGEILGYEARFVGSGERVKEGESRPGAAADGGGGAIVPGSLRIDGAREEVNVGDRLAPAAVRDFEPYVPHAPTSELNGVIVSLYGDALSGGQNQIVSINRGKRDGVERGHVLALWSEGRTVPDVTDPARPMMKLPDERQGLLFVFRVFERVSYALILQTNDPVHSGDRFSKP